ncbi:hypothetical protein ACRRTK_017309 [Alexandromys fortis]
MLPTIHWLKMEESQRPCCLFYTETIPVELTGSSVFDYVHPGDHVEMAEQLGMKLPPGRGLLSQGTAEDAASSASSSSQSETPEPGGNWVSMCLQLAVGGQDLRRMSVPEVPVWRDYK